MPAMVSFAPTTFSPLFPGLDIVLKSHTIFISHPPIGKPEDHKVYIDSPSVVFNHAAIWLNGAAVYIRREHHDGEIYRNGTKVSVHGVRLYEGDVLTFTFADSTPLKIWVSTVGYC